MATRKSAAKSAPKKRTEDKSASTDKSVANQKAAKQRTSRAAKEQEAQARATGDTDLQKFGDSDTETQKAAAGAAQVRVTSFTGDVPAQAVSQRVGSVEQALAERNRVLEQAQREQEQRAVVEQQNTADVMTNLQAPLRAPADNPTGPRAHGVNEVGVHPDVTSPTNLMAAETPALPGTGVADPRDLAPGQDMSPSPPVSSSNILPQPDKPGSNFSKL